MAFDESTISADARRRYLRIGRRFGSTAALALARQHLEALEKHAAALVEHGFGAEDAQQYAEAREALQAASTGRTAALGRRRSLVDGHKDALVAAGRARRSGRAILEQAARALREGGGEAAEDAARVIEGALAQTRRGPERDGEKLAEQLDVLRAKLGAPAVAAVTAGRGGPEAVARMQKAAAALRALTQQKTGREPAEATELLNLLEGLVVTLARSAWKAAREAAKELGRPALAEAFDLGVLYRHGRAPAGSEGPEAPRSAGASQVDPAPGGMQPVPTMPLPRAARVLDRIPALELAPLALPFALALAPLSGCSAAPKPAAPETPAAAEPAAPQAAPVPAAAAPVEEQAPADADDALSQLDRAEAELRGAMGPARDRAAGSPATPTPSSAPRKAPAGEAAPMAQGAELAGGDPCAVACRALGSMRRAADHLCSLAGEQDGRCTSARGRVRGADAEVRQTCPQCAP